LYAIAVFNGRHVAAARFRRHASTAPGYSTPDREVRWPAREWPTTRYCRRGWCCGRRGYPLRDREQCHHLACGPHHRTMQRQTATTVAAFEQRRVGIEHLSHAREIARLRGLMDGMILARRHTSQASAGFFEQSRDALVPALPRHHDQAGLVVSVPFGIGAGVEQELRGVGMSGAHGEMHRRCVSILRATEQRITREPLPQRAHVTGRRGGESCPDGVACFRVEGAGSNHRSDRCCLVEYGRYAGDQTVGTIPISTDEARSCNTRAQRRRANTVH
jgi:hypothetical protein